MELKLSTESERGLRLEVVRIIRQFLENFVKPKPRLLGLITPQEVCEELGVSRQTVRRWEDMGLRRYTPPTDDTKKGYYRIVDVLDFLGVER